MFGRKLTNKALNELSWLFLGERTPLAYHLSETILKILVIIFVFLLRGNHVSILLEIVHLNDR